MPSSFDVELPGGYRKLEIYQLARKVSVSIHKMSLTLPKFELYEQGSQIRRSSKSVRSNIVEGFGRRRYKQEFLRFLVFAHASCDETVDHLESLWESESLTNETVFKEIGADLRMLGAKIAKFISSVEEQHLSVKENIAAYGIARETSSSENSKVSP